jgi:hypothetical protein
MSPAQSHVPARLDAQPHPGVAPPFASCRSAERGPAERHLRSQRSVRCSSRQMGERRGRGEPDCGLRAEWTLALRGGPRCPTHSRRHQRHLDHHRVRADRSERSPRPPLPGRSIEPSRRSLPDPFLGRRSGRGLWSGRSASCREYGEATSSHWLSFRRTSLRPPRIPFSRSSRPHRLLRRRDSPDPSSLDLFPGPAIWSASKPFN